ncbi:MAG TPA: nucleoside triphosphate pyrophosphohydrolase [Acidimicrobiia bacterium]|nr:nucleoside triphosphate pyrophosphohydrolase [Acidimicrobiia bacterium]
MIDIVGLGPGDLDRVHAAVREMLTDLGRTVIVRTLQHPAASQLAAIRDVITCDDLYEASDTFDDVYAAIADRVLAAAPVVYAVPGSPTVGELAVARIKARSSEARIHPAESFLDLIFERFGIDPLADGFQLLNAHHLPSVLVFDVPTVIGHLDRPEILADTLARLDRALPEDHAVTVVAGLGARDEQVRTGPSAELPADLAGLRTSVFVPVAASGLTGAVQTMFRLRRECPWDRTQTHESLVRYLLEETAELTDAIAATAGDPDDLGAFAEVEEELGDVLLQVLFHAAIAEQGGAFDITDVAETLRRKLVRRHPHVFGEVDAADAETVKANWDEIKAAEKGGGTPGSALAGVPSSLGSLARAAELQRKAATVGFDWPAVHPVFEKVAEELGELGEAMRAGDEVAIDHELGDLLFAVVNIARHLRVEPELALRAASHRFEARFRVMESEGDLSGLSLAELDARWEHAKSQTEG